MVSAETIPFMNLEIIANSNSSSNFLLINNKLNFCCIKYSRGETIQWRKLYKEIRYIEL